MFFIGIAAGNTIKPADAAMQRITREMSRQSVELRDLVMQAKVEASEFRTTADSGHADAIM